MIARAKGLLLARAMIKTLAANPLFAVEMATANLVWMIARANPGLAKITATAARISSVVGKANSASPMVLIVRIVDLAIAPKEAVSAAYKMSAA